MKKLPNYLYDTESVVKFCEELKFYLAEEFFWHNPPKLPLPAECVNKSKIRVKDAVNTIWRFSKPEYPKADAREMY